MSDDWAPDEEIAVDRDDEGQVQGSKQRGRPPRSAGARKSAEAKKKAQQAAQKGEKGKSKRGGKKEGAGRKGTKGNRECQGCFKFFPPYTFPKGSMFEPKCKRARDNMFNSAKNNGEMDWFEEQMSSAGKRKDLFVRYDKLCPEDSTKKRKPCNILKLKQLCRTVNAVRNNKHGVMMWIGRFTHWIGKYKHRNKHTDKKTKQDKQTNKQATSGKVQNGGAARRLLT